MTGLAAVNGLRGDTSIEERCKFDNWYIDNWSLWLDTKILVRTVRAVRAGDRHMSGATYDFDLHGVVKVRLLDASPADAAKVARQLGLPATAPERHRRPHGPVRRRRDPSNR